MRIWFRKKVLAGLAIVLISYLILGCRKYNLTFTAVIPHAPPVELWEFVSDFANMKKLNPTITNFLIETESGNYDHWKYRVYYTEHLSHLSSFTNFAWADFEIKKVSKNSYAIYSKHKTCFFTSFTCVHTDSSFIIEPADDPSESKYTESILYECPAVLSSFCQQEVLHQREKIRDNLIRIFEGGTVEKAPRAYR